MKIMIALALLLGMTGMNGCGNGGCKVTYAYYAVIENTLSQAVEVEFRPGYYDYPEQVRLIEPGQASFTFTRKEDTRRTEKSSINWYTFCGSDDQEIRTEVLEFSNATLAQYTICRSESWASSRVTTYKVSAFGDTCPGPPDRKEDRGY